MTTLRQRTLGDILAEERLIARSQLEQAQRAANRSGAPLVVVLLEQGLVAEEALVDALCKHLDVEVFDPIRTEVDVDAVREIPVDEANRFRLLPVRVARRGGRRLLRVAMADPLDHQTIEEIEFATGCTVEPLIARPSDLADAIRNQYRNVVTKIIPRGHGPTSGMGDGELAATPGAGPGAGAASSEGSGASGARRLFGAGLRDTDLHTKPVRRVQQESTPAHRIDALVALLIRKGVITQDEYEEQLASLVHAKDV
ncbi:MAG: hypothetical protein KC503_14750 [Myxococcales bacterium]|nr:hypothetical protein [Myxococcales bacterium]